MIDPYKKRVYSDICERLVEIQKCYYSISKELRHRAVSLIPRNKEEVAQLDSLPEQADLAELHVDRIEELKYLCSISILTEGALISEIELMVTIDLLEKLAAASYEEIETNEDAIAKWARSKIDLFDDIKQILMQIMEYKTNRKDKLGVQGTH